jgi:phosphate starvation-inducible PhoH-like protein
MKMFLTRMGFSSKFVVTGDATQRDLVGPGGLDQAREVLAGIEDIEFVDLGCNDIVRSALAARIVDAYDRAAEHGAKAPGKGSGHGKRV